MIGKTLDGRYRIERLLGEGGMGAVYEATHLGTDRRVAVKLIQQLALGDTDVFNRFRREARASSAIDTRHIISVLDSGRDPETGMPFMAMDLLKGDDLGAVIDRRGALGVDLALRIVAQACTGLAKAHRAFVVHRDIKPPNLFLSQEEDDEVIVKLLDFGIAKVRPQNPLESEGTHLTQTGRLLGTPLYMSPEQAQGLKDIDHRTDIWSLGGVLYEALTGRSPFCEADNLGKLILAICGKPPKPPSALTASVPPEVDAIVMRALAIEREARYPTADDMLRDLTSLFEGGDEIFKEEIWAEGFTTAPVRRSRSERRERSATKPVIGASWDTKAVEEAGVASTLYATSVPNKRKLYWVLGAAGLLGLITVSLVLFFETAEQRTSRTIGPAAPSTGVTAAVATNPAPPASDSTATKEVAKGPESSAALAASAAPSAAVSPSGPLPPAPSQAPISSANSSQAHSSALPSAKAHAAPPPSATLEYAPKFE